MKASIGEMEEALDRLLEIAKPGDTFTIDGVTHALVDNFAGKNTVFQAKAFRRFDLKAMK